MIKESSNKLGQIVDIKTVKKLFKTNPLKIYTVKLDNGLFVDMRIHAIGKQPNVNQSKKQFKSAPEGFKTAWKEAMTGQTHPVSELWTDIDIHE